MTEYSPWSVCSVSCGKGLRFRNREYVNSALAKHAACDRQLVSREMCVADTPLCPSVFYTLFISLNNIVLVLDQLCHVKFFMCQCPCRKVISKALISSLT